MKFILLATLLFSWGVIASDFKVENLPERVEVYTMLSTRVQKPLHNGKRYKASEILNLSKLDQAKVVSLLVEGIGYGTAILRYRKDGRIEDLAEINLTTENNLRKSELMNVSRDTDFRIFIWNR